MVLLDTYEVDEHQIAGPGWLKQTRFDIQATIPAGAARAQVPQMLQRLLADRFGLIAHVERRPVDVYELVVTGRGIKVLEVEPVNELTKIFPTAGGATSSDVVEGEGKQTRTIMTTGGLKMVTTRALWDQRITNRGTWQVDATRMSMADLVMLLGGMVDRPVLDKTALTGVYQFKVELPHHERREALNTHQHCPGGFTGRLCHRLRVKLHLARIRSLLFAFGAIRFEVHHRKSVRGFEREVDGPFHQPSIAHDGRRRFAEQRATSPPPHARRRATDGSIPKGRPARADATSSAVAPRMRAWVATMRLDDVPSPHRAAPQPAMREPASP